MKRQRSRKLAVLALAVACFAMLTGCGAGDPEIEDDGLTILNPHDGIWQDREEVPIQFELEQTFGAEEEPVEAILGSVNFPLVDDAGNVYLFDRGGHRLVSFDPDGALRWSSGREGEGPGEFQNPRSMVWDGRDRLYVLNQMGRQLDAFGMDGTYIETMAVDFDSLSFPGVAGFIQPDLFVFQSSLSGRLGARVLIARKGATWEEVAMIEEDQTGDAEAVEGLSGGPSVWVDGDLIVVGHVDEYRFALYDTTGTLRRVVRRDMHELMRPGIVNNGEMRAIGSFSSLGPFIRLQSGHALAMASWAKIDDPDEEIRRLVENQGGDAPERESAHNLDLYDAEDRLLYSVLGDEYTPEIGRLAFVDDAGRLYTSVYEPYPQLRRYRVVVGE